MRSGQRTTLAWVPRSFFGAKYDGADVCDGRLFR